MNIIDGRQCRFYLPISVVPTFTAYTTKANDLLALSRSGDNEGAAKLLYSEVTPIGSKVIEAAGKLVAINEKAAEAAYESSQEIYNTSLTIALLSIAVCVAIIGLSVWFALSGIASPILTITAAMKKLADGDSSSAIPYEGRADEIGQMAAAVEVFRANAVANLRLEEEADANRSLTEQQRQQKAAAARARVENGSGNSWPRKRPETSGKRRPDLPAV